MSFAAERITKTRVIRLDGPLNSVFPLFGPIEEAKWAPGWAPKIVYLTGGVIEEHMVFVTAAHHGQESVFTWTVSRYDPGNAFVEYTVFTPDRLWWISIQCRETSDPMNTEAEISYTYTGLTDLGNHLNRQALDHMFEHDLKDWQEQINAYLEKDRQLK